MLDLDSPRWLDFQSHFGTPSDVPRLVSAWKAAVGTEAEEDAYAELYEHYLHQETILSCAYAVVPHVVSVLASVPFARRLDYLTDVVRAERHRLPVAEVEALVAEMRTSTEIPEELRDHFLTVTRDRHPELPADLAPDYLRALEEARTHALAMLREPSPPPSFSRLLGIITALFAKEETLLACALMQPDGLWIECEYEGKASISMLLSDRQPPD